MPKVILCSVVKYTNKESHRRENDSALSICELESLIALQNARGLYGKNHPSSFCLQ